MERYYDRKDNVKRRGERFIILKYYNLYDELLWERKVTRENYYSDPKAKEYI